MTAASALEVPSAEPSGGSARRGSRPGWGWMWIVVGLLVVGGVGAVISAAGDPVARGLFDPESAGPDGTRAVVEILREQGVDVTVARDLDAVHSALDGSASTLIMPDSAYLSDDALSSLIETATDAVVLSPTARATRVLFPGAIPAGVGPAHPIDPSCVLAAAVRSGAITSGIMFDPAGSTATACYLDDGRAALLVDEEGDRRVSLLDAREMFTNAHLAEHGNAALALNLMGRHPAAVWYVPSPADSDLTDSSPSLGELTPPWVTPVMVLLVCTAAVAAVWRGRRFGPLVVENLPVTVRASETMEGRARLAARSRDSVGALDSLRLATLDRLAGLLGLGASAEAGAIADACADRIGAQRHIVHDILIGHVPVDDDDLVSSADRLRDLETAVRTAVRPERNHR